MLFSKKSPSLFLSFHVCTHVYTYVFLMHTSKYQAIFISRSLRTCLRSKSHFNIAFLCAPRDEHVRAKRPPRLYTRRCIISIDSRTRVPARVTWIAAYRDGPSSARRAASQYKVSPSFPYPPTLPPSTSASFAPPALAHPPSRAINERVIDARSVNRLLPFINSPGRRAAVAA